jgi:hypothetical protein
MHTLNEVKLSLENHKAFAQHYYKLAVNQKTNNTTLKTPGIVLDSGVVATIYENLSSHKDPLHKYERSSAFNIATWQETYELAALVKAIKDREALTPAQVTEGYTERWTYPDYVCWKVQKDTLVHSQSSSPALMSTLQMVTNKAIGEIALVIVETCKVKNLSRTAVPDYRYVCIQSVCVETQNVYYYKDTLAGNATAEEFFAGEVSSPILNTVMTYYKNHTPYNLDKKLHENKENIYNSLMVELDLPTLTALTPAMLSTTDAFFDHTF